MGVAELDCQWHFAEQIGGRDDGPNDPMAENFKKTPYASLIRESIQNSLDAVCDKEKPVKVEFNISSINRNSYPNFFGIKEDIEGCLEYYKNNLNAQEAYTPMLGYLENVSVCGNKLFYIRVSDYNTCGMDYISENTDCPFYAFVRAAGVTSKSDLSAGGSFGYGKAAYFYMSPIRSIIVSTLTDERKYFFEGVSSLCTHVRDRIKRVSVGYYDNNNGEPIEECDKIPERFRRKEVGTDIFIMGIQAAGVEERANIFREMEEAVLRNFWMSIYKNKLVVRIGDREITNENIVSMMSEYFEEYDLTAKKTLSNYNPRPYLEAVRLAEIDKNHVLIQENLPCLGHVNFYAYKTKEANDKILYMRSPLMLVYAKRNQSNNGFYGVFVCDDKQGNEILRKLENPAHDEWKEGNWKIPGTSKAHRQAKEAMDELREFIIRCIANLFSKNAVTAINITGLEDYLYIPTALENDKEDEYELLTNQSLEKMEGEGNRITTKIAFKEKKKIGVSQATGKVMFNTTAKAVHSKDGGLLSGHSNKKIKQKGGGVSTSHLTQRNTLDENGKEGTFANMLPVHYRIFAQVVNGNIVHNIIIYSDFEIQDGRLDLVVGGVQDDEIVDIETTTVGVARGNSIFDVPIIKGKNPMICIKFADNMQHAVKLEAYEIE